MPNNQGGKTIFGEQIRGRYFCKAALRRGIPCCNMPLLNWDGMSPKSGGKLVLAPKTGPGKHPGAGHETIIKLAKLRSKLWEAGVAVR